MPPGSNRITNTSTIPNSDGSRPGRRPTPNCRSSRMMAMTSGSSRHEQRAEDHTMQRPQATHEHDGDELHRQQHVERIRCEVAHVMREQRAGQPGDECADREGEGLVPREIDAHALRRDFAVADRHHGAAQRRAQQVCRQPQHDHQHEEREIVDAIRTLYGYSEDVGRRHREAVETAGDRVPFLEHGADDAAERQRCDGKVEAAHAQRRQADQDAEQTGQQTGGRQRDQQRHTVGEQDRLGVGADAEKGRVAQADQAGVAGQ